MPTSPVIEMQQQAGATFGEVHGWQVPSAYSSLDEEYRAATEGVGLVDRSYVGRLKATGEDALDLIHRLSTNDLLPLQANEGACTVLTSAKGRIVDLTLVLRLQDRRFDKLTTSLLLFTAPENRQKVAEWIDFYTFAEDISLRDITEETAMFSVLGPNATRLLHKATGRDAASMPRYASRTAAIGGVEATLVRSDFAGLPGYDLVANAADAPRLWTELLASGKELGIRPVGTRALDVVRVEQGVPAYGRELSEDYNPLEANLRDFISFTKGCYIGQEVVARLDTYKKVQKYLVGLSWDGDHIPGGEAYLTFDGKRAGKITSAVKSPRLGKMIGLGYVRKEQATTGATLTLESPEGVEVHVEALPF
ncbi:MAG: aminomethyltransferase family protein, partial [Chloroflexi bacterium]|nr:aminomethyltransferase family protein [Chloroflexota bacterium]